MPQITFHSVFHYIVVSWRKSQANKTYRIVRYHSWWVTLFVRAASKGQPKGVWERAVAVTLNTQNERSHSPFGLIPNKMITAASFSHARARTQTAEQLTPPSEIMYCGFLRAGRCRDEAFSMLRIQNKWVCLYATSPCGVIYVEGF